MAVNKWTLATIIECAQKCSTYKDFRTQYIRAYEVCLKNKWTSEVKKTIGNGNIQWNKKLVLESAASFQHRTKWERACGGAHGYAVKHGFIDEATTHMSQLRKNNWTKEECIKKASLYKTPSQWYKNDWASYKAAHNHGWHKEIIATMNKLQKSWDDKSVKEEALKYNSANTWRKASSGSFSYAKKNGIFKECTEHMPVFISNKWLTIESCHKEALKYETRAEFQAGSGGCYTTCLQKRWLDEICSHMPKHSSKSLWQKEIQEFLSQNISHPVLNDDWSCLKSLEIDHYIPKLKLGIEDSGLYWHSEKAAYARLHSQYKKSISWQNLLEFSKNIQKVRKIHKTKLNKMRESGDRLITICENEWRDRKPQIKNYLKSVLGVYSVTIPTQKCTVRCIDKKESFDFIEKNHIQGGKMTGVFHLGLFYGDKLVGAMEAAKHPNKKDILLLGRMCFEDGYCVSGGEHELFNEFKKEATKRGFKKIISRSDNRWSEGDLYEKLGFAMKEELPPNYMYVRNKDIVSKQFLKKNPKKYGVDKTEYELALETNLFRIYDCGKKLWVYLLSQ